MIYPLSLGLTCRLPGRQTDRWYQGSTAILHSLHNTLLERLSKPNLYVCVMSLFVDDVIIIFVPCTCTTSYTFAWTRLKWKDSTKTSWISKTRKQQWPYVRALNLYFTSTRTRVFAQLNWLRQLHVYPIRTRTSTVCSTSLIFLTWSFSRITRRDTTMLMAFPILASWNSLATWPPKHNKYHLYHSPTFCIFSLVLHVVQSTIITNTISLSCIIFNTLTKELII